VVTSLNSLWRFFFGFMAADAAAEPYWTRRFARIHQAQNKPFGDQWADWLTDTQAKGAGFRRSNQFRCVPYVQRAQPLLDAKVPISDVIGELDRRFLAQPPRIGSRRAAIQCRRLLAVELSFVTQLRPDALRTLRCTQLLTGAKLELELHIPEEQLRNGGTSGGEDGIHGPLAAWPHLERLLRMYIEEARPILLGDSDDKSDAGYLFVCVSSVDRGGQSALLRGGAIGE
jgi:hypothetical protein